MSIKLFSPCFQQNENVLFLSYVSMNGVIYEKGFAIKKCSLLFFFSFSLILDLHPIFWINKNTDIIQGNVKSFMKKERKI